MKRGLECGHRLLEKSVTDEARNADVNVTDAVEHVAAELLGNHITDLIL